MMILTERGVPLLLKISGIHSGDQWPLNYSGNQKLS